MPSRTSSRILISLIVVGGLTFGIGWFTAPKPPQVCTYCEGRRAAQAGLLVTANPYLIDFDITPEGRQWVKGWEDAFCHLHP